MFKYLAVLLVLCCIPFGVKADISKQFGFSGTWFVYGFALYQPIERLVTPAVGAKQVLHEPGFSYGFGVGKDHVRIELTKYLDEPRFLAAFDFFPKALVTPYVGYVYSKGLKSSDSTGVLKSYVTRGEILGGISFQPIRFMSVYVEYLTRDSFFFAGVRVKLPYTVD